VRGGERKQGGRLPLGAPLFVVAHELFRGIDEHRAGVAVEDEGGALGNVQDPLADPDRSRNAERAGEDRAVRSRPAEGGRNAAHELAIKRSRVGGREITCDDDAGLDDGGGRRFAQELAHHLARHAGQVLCPRAEILVIEVAVLGRNSLGRRVPGLRGVLALLEDRAPGGLEQCVVVEEEQVGVEDGGAVLARPGGDGLAG